MVKVLTMGKNLHYDGQNDVARDKVLKQLTVFVTATLQYNLMSSRCQQTVTCIHIILLSLAPVTLYK